MRQERNIPDELYNAIKFTENKLVIDIGDEDIRDEIFKQLNNLIVDKKIYDNAIRMEITAFNLTFTTDLYVYIQKSIGGAAFSITFDKFVNIVNITNRLNRKIYIE